MHRPVERLALCACSGLLFTCVAVAPQGAVARQEIDFSTELRDWVSYAIPPEGSPERVCAERSMKSWKVAIGNGNAVVHPFEGIDIAPLPLSISPELLGSMQAPDLVASRHRHVVRVSDGWLVGLDAGEWGGALLWMSTNGSSGVRLADDIVRGIVRAQGELLAFTGVLWSADNRAGAGAVLRVYREADRWSVETIALLPAFPMAVGVDGNTVLVVAREALFRVSMEGKVDKLHDLTLDFLYPNSIVVQEEDIYIGMRHFVVRLTLANNVNRESWLVPRGCQQFRLIETERTTDCVCFKEQ